MKSSRVTEFRNMTIDELKLHEADMRREIFNLRFQQATGEMENPKRMGAVKKDIARILTIISEKAKQGGR